MGIRFLKIAVIYLAIGVIAGVAMGILHQFQYAPVHAHLGLLGWASLALAGLIYHFYPEAAKTRLAKLHFWMHNLGLPVFLLGLFVRVSDGEIAGPLLKLGALTTLVGVQLFVVNIVRNVRGPDASAAISQATLRVAARAPDAR
jgi:cbb3-type cytochrome oxidase subunit 1